MSTELKFKTIKAKGRFSTDARSCLGRIVHNANLSLDGIAADFAKYAKLDENEARFQAARFISYLVKAIGEGKRLNLGAFSLFLSLKGCIDGANGKFNPKKNKVELNICVQQPLADALAQLEPVNVTLEDEKLVINSVMDSLIKEEGKIAPGATVYIAGHTFLIDASRDDEGVWLEDAAGSKLIRARVLNSTATTLDCAFDGSAAPGAYRIAVYSRMGDADRDAPAVARRNVQLIAP